MMLFFGERFYTPHIDCAATHVRCQTGMLVPLLINNCVLSTQVVLRPALAFDKLWFLMR